MSNRCVVQLTTDRRLLSRDFDGYRLAGAGSGPQPFRGPGPRVSRATAPSANPLSLLHSRLFALHNALTYDAFSSTAYLVDDDGVVWRTNPREPSLKVSDAISDNWRSCDGAYPATLSMCGDRNALLADGDCTLVLFSTGDRSVAEPPLWTVDARLENVLPESGFSILDARISENGDVHCLLYRVRPEGSLCVAVVHWVILVKDGDCWRVEPHRTLKSRGVIHYCVLEPGCASVYVAADKPVDFEDKPKTSAPESATEEDRKILYSWMQNAEEIMLTLKLDPGFRKSLLVVDSSRDNVEVRYDGSVFVKGKLFASVDCELTTWSVDSSNKLNIMLLKCEPQIVWPSFMKDGDANGEQIMDPSYVAEVHARLAHLCSETEITTANNVPLFNSQQLEECDFVSEDEACLWRLESENYRISHQAFLSSNPVILNVSLNPSEALAIGLRHDTDACIWQPYKAADDNTWPIKHEGTLLAFGYVQSSKQQKKYTVCSPDLRYSVVCEADRHAFIYQQEWGSQQNLRHRNLSGDNRHINVGKQQLLSFDRDEEVLGICATNDVLYILTDKSFIILNMTE